MSILFPSLSLYIFALTLLVGRQEVHLACKNLPRGSLRDLPGIRPNLESSSSGSSEHSHLVSTSWRHSQQSKLCWDQEFGTEGWIQLFGAMSTSVDLPRRSQSAGRRLMAARRMREWFCDGSALAKCLNRRSRLCDNWGDWRLTCSKPHLLVGDTCCVLTM